MICGDSVESFGGHYFTKACSKGITYRLSLTGALEAWEHADLASIDQDRLTICLDLAACALYMGRKTSAKKRDCRAGC